ncbi:hypothetical protein SAMN04487950_0807 [Halogranum rubrum]|uniref:Uncharacterized protein n=1 Tax=Halogranum rubrum TaxID=553466 RepID=A0A1I4BWE6_9EURY|nr:hypothetical protein [Halogranum rubrum]SFK72975.1 hypothetical protein SAMN04487950_0807 [Halogranum rubrum]
MRFKLVPAAPADLSFVADAQRAVPLVPGSEDDCCARLMRRLDLPSRDVARTWLTFLRALELVEETPSGFKRRRVDPTDSHLREAFRRRVFGAEEVLAALGEADGPLTAEEAFEQFRERVPVWEHHKNPQTWEELWTERVGDLLEWLVLLDLAEQVEETEEVQDVDGVSGGFRPSQSR